MKARIQALFFAGLLALARQAAADEAPKEILGCWESTNTDPKATFRLTPAKVYLHVGELSVVGPARYTKDHVAFRRPGQEMSYRFELVSGKLTLVSTTSGSFVLRKLDSVPPEVADPKPLELPAPTQLPKDRLKAIKKELDQRLEKDQAVRMKLVALSRNEEKAALEAASREMKAVDSANTAYLSSTCLEVGWIDVGRFGKNAANAAFLIVQHSESLPLMLAALPGIETDTQAGSLDGQSYALLYDRSRLRLGDRQRYGTQVVQDDSGTLVVSLLEDRKKVDAYRKSLGLGTLDEYLDDVKKAYGGKTVKIEDSED